MKRVLLLSSFVFAGLFSNAQGQIQIRDTKSRASGVVKQTNVKSPSKSLGGSKKRSTSGWISYQDAIYVDQTSKASLYPVTADSNLYIPPSANGGNFNWWVHGVGTSFDPTAAYFTNSPNVDYDETVNIKLSDAYVIDSIEVLGRYERYKKNQTDTLIIEISHTSQPGTTVLQSKGSFYSVNLGLADSTLRFATSEYDYLNNNMSASAVTSKVVIKKVLDDAAFADSLASGLHDFRIKLPAPLSCAAGSVVDVLTTFKSSVAYPLGTFLDSSNYWNHYCLEAGGTDTYPGPNTGDITSGLVITINDRYRLKDTDNVTPLYVEVGGKQYIEPTYWFGATSGLDDPYFGFYINCATCSPNALNNNIGVDELNIFPNPTSDNIYITFEQLVASNNTKVEILNTLGDIVYSKDLGAQSGRVDARIDIANLNSGVYFCKLTVDGKSTTKKINKL